MRESVVLCNCPVKSCREKDGAAWRSEVVQWNQAVMWCGVIVQWGAAVRSSRDAMQSSVTQSHYAMNWHSEATQWNNAVKFCCEIITSVILCNYPVNYCGEKMLQCDSAKGGFKVRCSETTACQWWAVRASKAFSAGLNTIRITNLYEQPKLEYVFNEIVLIYFQLCILFFYCHVSLGCFPYMSVDYQSFDQSDFSLYVQPGAV